MGSLGPTAMASLSSKVLLVTVSTPDDDDMSSMPPPNPPPAALPRASLPADIAVGDVSVPWLEMPPPATAELPLTVQLVSVAVPYCCQAAAMPAVRRSCR